MAVWYTKGGSGVNHGFLTLQENKVRPLCAQLLWCKKIEVDALGIITISHGCFERCGSNKKTPP